MVVERWGVDEGLQEKVRLVKEGRKEEGCGKREEIPS